MIRITDHPNLSSAVYAPNFEKVDGAYCILERRAWLHACVTFFVTNETRIFSFPSYLPFLSYGPLKCLEKKSCQQDISKSI